ncbi:MAG: hypothetical protein AUG49_02625 [Catenulispora sp. 13_1_20CM_3_70_7]|nr:MAG: hypothetical protein AUG49_02625 [Catenulispora sp. 13_1_20CM_3_70_7]
MGEMEEATALAWLCAHLPRFRLAAGTYTRLESLVGEVRDGRRTAVAVLAELGFEDDGESLRGDGLASLGGFGIDPVPVAGDYVCPYDRCDRRGVPDERGREPRCDLGAVALPMRFRPRLGA